MAFDESKLTTLLNSFQDPTKALTQGNRITNFVSYLDTQEDFDKFLKAFFKHIETSNTLTSDKNALTKLLYWAVEKSPNPRNSATQRASIVIQHINSNFNASINFKGKVPMYAKFILEALDDDLFNPASSDLKKLTTKFAKYIPADTLTKLETRLSTIVSQPAIRTNSINQRLGTLINAWKLQGSTTPGQTQSTPGSTTPGQTQSTPGSGPKTQPAGANAFKTVGDLDAAITETESAITKASSSSAIKARAAELAKVDTFINRLAATTDPLIKSSAEPQVIAKLIEQAKLLELDDGHISTLVNRNATAVTEGMRKILNTAKTPTAISLALTEVDDFLNMTDPASGKPLINKGTVLDLNTFNSILKMAPAGATDSSAITSKQIHLLHGLAHEAKLVNADSAALEASHFFARNDEFGMFADSVAHPGVYKTSTPRVGFANTAEIDVAFSKVATAINDMSNSNISKGVAQKEAIVFMEQLAETSSTVKGTQDAKLIATLVENSKDLQLKSAHLVDLATRDGSAFTTGIQQLFKNAGTSTEIARALDRTDELLNAVSSKSGVSINKGAILTEDIFEKILAETPVSNTRVNFTSPQIKLLQELADAGKISNVDPAALNTSFFGNATNNANFSKFTTAVPPPKGFLDTAAIDKGVQKATQAIAAYTARSAPADLTTAKQTVSDFITDIHDTPSTFRGSTESTFIKDLIQQTKILGLNDDLLRKLATRDSQAVADGAQAILKAATTADKVPDALKQVGKLIALTEPVSNKLLINSATILTPDIFKSIMTTTAKSTAGITASDFTGTPVQTLIKLANSAAITGADAAAVETSIFGDIGSGKLKEFTTVGAAKISGTGKFSSQSRFGSVTLSGIELSALPQPTLVKIKNEPFLLSADSLAEAIALKNSAIVTEKSQGSNILKYVTDALHTSKTPLNVASEAEAIGKLFTNLNALVTVNPDLATEFKTLQTALLDNIKTNYATASINQGGELSKFVSSIPVTAENVEPLGNILKSGVIKDVTGGVSHGSALLRGISTYASNTNNGWTNTLKADVTDYIKKTVLVDVSLVKDASTAVAALDALSAQVATLTNTLGVKSGTPVAAHAVAARGIIKTALDTQTNNVLGAIKSLAVLTPAPGSAPVTPLSEADMLNLLKKGIPLLGDIGQEAKIKDLIDNVFHDGIQNTPNAVQFNKRLEILTDVAEDSGINDKMTHSAKSKFVSELVDTMTTHATDNGTIKFQTLEKLTKTPLFTDGVAVLAAHGAPADVSKLEKFSAAVFTRLSKTATTNSNKTLISDLVEKMYATNLQTKLTLNADEASISKAVNFLKEIQPTLGLANSVDDFTLAFSRVSTGIDLLGHPALQGDDGVVALKKGISESLLKGISSGLTTNYSVGGTSKSFISPATGLFDFNVSGGDESLKIIGKALSLAPETAKEFLKDNASKLDGFTADHLKSIKAGFADEAKWADFVKSNADSFKGAFELHAKEATLKELHTWHSLFEAAPSLKDSPNSLGSVIKQAVTDKAFSEALSGHHLDTAEKGLIDKFSLSDKYDNIYKIKGLSAKTVNIFDLQDSHSLTTFKNRIELLAKHRFDFTTEQASKLGFLPDRVTDKNVLKNTLEAVFTDSEIDFLERGSASEIGEKFLKGDLAHGAKHTGYGKNAGYVKGSKLLNALGNVIDKLPADGSKNFGWSTVGDEDIAKGFVKQGIQDADWADLDASRDASRVNPVLRDAKVIRDAGLHTVKGVLKGWAMKNPVSRGLVSVARIAGLTTLPGFMINVGLVGLGMAGTKYFSEKEDTDAYKATQNNLLESEGA